MKIFDFVLINYINIKNTCKNKPLIRSSSNIMVVIAFWHLFQFHTGESHFQKNPDGWNVKSEKENEIAYFLKPPHANNLVL